MKSTRLMGRLIWLKLVAVTFENPVRIDLLTGKVYGVDNFESQAEKSFFTDRRAGGDRPGIVKILS
jgi:hypothetical protein